MKRKIIRMGKKPAIELCGLNFATRTLVAKTVGKAVEGQVYEVPALIIVRLKECTAVSENGEKDWNAHLEEVKA